MTDAAFQRTAVDGHDLRDIGDRVAIETRRLRPEEDVAGSLCPSHIARDRDAHDRPYAALVERIALYDDDGPAEAGRGPARCRQLSPAHVTLRDYQSIRSSACRADAATNASVSGRI